MAWGTGTTVEDASAYEGPQTGYPDEFESAQGGNPIAEESFQVGSPTLNQQKISDKFSFYLDDNQFGAIYSDAPFSANINIGEGGQANWGANVSEQVGPFGARIGILGQGTSGSVSPYADFNVSPLPGLNFNLHGQSYPGGYSELNPSASYQNQFDTPWGTVDYNIGRQGGRTIGGFNVRGDF